MARTTAFTGLLTSLLCLATGASPSWAAVTVADMLTVFKPDFPDVQLTTPSADEYASCDLKWIEGTRPGSGSWVLRDAKKQLLRRYSITGGKSFDTWSYYKDGVEVFREIDSNFNGRKDQYRWLNSAGMKWGHSRQENGKITFWQYISAEEASQEVFAALATGDVGRLEALFITDAELKTLPVDEARRIDGLVKGATSKFQATRAKLPQLDAKAHLERVEAAPPNCVPAEANGTDQFRFPYRTLLFESGGKDKKHDWVQTGEMIKIGMAWRLVDGPSLPEGEPSPTPGTGPENVALRKLFDALTILDDPKTAPAPLMQPGNNTAVQNYNLSRVALLEKIAEQVSGPDRETWIKQICDNLSAAYQAGHAASLTKLQARRDQLAKDLPGSNLAAYGAYRYLWASYGDKINGRDAAKYQEEWLNQLAQFAQAYPKAEDTPEALGQLAMGSEFSGKDEEAKRWYQQIYQNFPNHPQAAKAKGSEARLNLVGQPIALTGPELGANPPKNFDIASLKGKVVVVYYWASNVRVCERDFDTLKRLRTAHAKDMELVCVCLDDTATSAAQFLQKAQVPGVHLFQAPPDGVGLNSPLGTAYGINGLPHLFLVGRDGRVVDRTLQVGDLAEALRKAL